MARFEDKIVIITGSTRGIGLATARAFLEEGARVVVFCRHAEHGEEARAQLAEFADDKVFVTAGDVRVKDDVRRIVKETQERFGDPEILINNAGVALWKNIDEMSEDDYDTVLDTNLKGAWLFAREVVPGMKRKGWGRIVQISSGLGLGGDAKYSAYSPSKFGMIGMQQALDAELEKSGVRVYSVCPGAVNTKLHLDMHPWEKGEDMMQPEDIAPHVLDAADDKHSAEACITVYER